MEKNMQENFEKLEGRVFDSLYNSDLEKINYILSKINTPILISGVGGSSVVSEYASKILNRKNKIITRNIEPRDIKYMNINGYHNIMSCSYSGNNYGVDLSFDNDLNKYLLSSNESTNKNVTNITYKVSDKEHSFISLGATLIPCSILLNYYLDNEKEYIIDNLDSINFSFNTECDAYEIFSGLDTSSASKYLESTMVESGIGIPIVHDKYAYCHGRSTISTTYKNCAIYFDSHTDLDKLLIGEIRKYYKEVVILEYHNTPLSEFLLLMQCMYLTKYIAESKSKDLSGVDYSPIVKKVYKFNGNI